jgi:hypothetical protein
LQEPTAPLEDDEEDVPPEEDPPDEPATVPTRRVSVRSVAFRSIFPPQARKTREAAKT